MDVILTIDEGRASPTPTLHTAVAGSGMRVSQMRKLLGIYLISLGAIELLSVLIGERIPVIARPYAGILWRSEFVESPAASSIFSVSTALVLLAVGASVLQRHRRWLLVAFAIVYGLIAIIDLSWVALVFLSGGSFELPMAGAAFMLLVGFFVDWVPVALSLGTLVKRANPPPTSAQ